MDRILWTLFAVLDGAMVVSFVVLCAMSVTHNISVDFSLVPLTCTGPVMVTSSVFTM